MPKASPIIKLAHNDPGNLTQLPLMRKFLSFKAEDNNGWIDVIYEEYYESPGGAKLDRSEKYYRVAGAKFEQWDTQ